ncbi:MAG: NAD(P)H-dependent oxidoreductase [Pseudomonadota bacterium]
MTTTTTATPTKILRVDASGRYAGSTTRELTDLLISQFEGAAVTTRDLAANPVEFVDEAWIGANFTDPAERSTAQQERLAGSDALVAEVQAADTLVIGVPIYNFGVPAVLKAWIDQIARARVTFKYTENGPVGLLEGKRAYLVIASGGTPAGSNIDFATGYMRHVLGFIGIHDVHVIAADQMMAGGEAKLEAAKGKIALLADVA